jgi:hypothetical protein
MDLGSGWLNLARRREKNGKENDHAVSTMSATLPPVRSPVAAVIIRMETVRRGPLLVEALALKSLGGERHLHPPKYLLQSADGIVLLERNVHLHQHTFAGYLCSKSHSVRSTLYLSASLV